MRHLVLAFALTALFGIAEAKTTPPPAATTPITTALTPTKDQGEAGLWASRYLSRFHYKPMPLDDAMSEKIFDGYLDSLDGDHLFFTQADIDKFKPARDQMDDAIETRDLSVPFAIYNLYRTRIGERVAGARKVIAAGITDFSKDESYKYDRTKAPWAADSAALDDIWRQRIKNDWLRLKLAGKADKDIKDTLDKRYATYLDRVQQISSEDVFQTFMNAYATAIEPHTNYLGPRASENFDIAMKLSLEGIGAVLTPDEDYTAIREVVPGGPAALTGKVKVGDRIVAVGQGKTGPMVDVVGWRLDDVVEKIRGPKDTTVRIEVLPADAGVDGKNETIAIVRQKVKIEDQAAKKSIIEVKEGDTTRRIGVILLPTFYQDFEARRRGDEDYRSATRDVGKLLAELRTEKVDGVLVDLRNNGGGSLAEATDLTGLFVPPGPVVQVRSASGKVEVENSTEDNVAWDGPLAILVNRASASASEIFAAAIQDYGRGVIIGEPSFGKGTVQYLLDLDNIARNEKPTFGELKMTTAQFFRIDGGSTQLRGVTPDIGFPTTLDAGDFGESSYKNALPWTSIPPAKYQRQGEVASVVPMLITQHDNRVADDQEWKDYKADLADSRRLRDEKTISLNETVRRKERDEQDAKLKARSERDKAAEEKSDVVVTSKPTAAGVPVDEEDTDEASLRDDGLQAGERGLQEELRREKERKARPDFVLNEAAHILADEIGMLKADTKLAARVLPLESASQVD